MSSGELDREILAHIGRFRISIREIVSRLFFDGHSEKATDALTRLRDEGRLQIHTRALGETYSYYQLTAKGCAEVGVSAERARALTGKGLSNSLAALWFTHMNGRRRAHLPTEKLLRGCPPPPGQALHVAEEISPSAWCVYRLQMVAEKATHTYAFAQIEKTASDYCTIENGEAFLRSGVYGFAVLVHEPSKRDRFVEALPSLLTKLPDGVRVIIEAVPTPHNIKHFLSQ
jgi:hypothetical protein